MRLRVNSAVIAALAMLASISVSSWAQSTTRQADTVVLRVVSPRSGEIVFSGVITLRDARTERRLENVRTPFELRLPAQAIDARFTANDGGSLGGEIVSYRGEKEHGRVNGQMYFGDVRLYFTPGGRFGFGPQVAERSTP